MEQEKKKSIRDEFAEKFISLLESSEPLAWTKGWRTNPCAMAINGGSGRKYNGINRLMLMLESWDKGWNDNRFYTFHQIAQMENCKVRKGEKASKVEYWMVFDKKEKKSLRLDEYRKLLKDDPTRAEDEFQLYPKTAYVFNAEQVDGLPPLPTQEHNAIETDELVEAFIDTLSENMGVNIIFGGGRAFYSPTTDCIHLPIKDDFISAEEYYGTNLHEFAHATGVANRLNRNMESYYSNPSEYSIEELRAEISSTYLYAELGIEMPQTVIENHMAYVQSWLSKIKENPNVLFSAIKDAEQITDYLLDIGRIEDLREKLSVAKEMPKDLENTKYEIWQLKDIPENDVLFSVDFNYASKFRLTESRYDKVYEGVATDEDNTLDKLFYKFNVCRPDNFTGHSMSVSDVVVFDVGGKRTAWYCDKVGFKEIQDFCKSQAKTETKGLVR